MSKMPSFKKLNSLVLVLLVLLLVNILLFRQVIVNGKVPVAFDYGVYNYQPWKLDYAGAFENPPKAVGHDDIRIFYPQRTIIIEALKQGKLPFWNPYEFAGNVLQANSQTAVFYPPFILFFIFPQVIAWTILSFSIPLIIGVGFFLFLRRILKENSAAIFGAVVLAFSGAVLTRSEDGLVAGHSIIWLPWALYGIELMFKKRKFTGYFVTAASLSFSVLAGWFQFTFYVFATGFAYALFRWWRRKGIRNFLLLASVFLTSLLITAFHWLPAVEALQFSPRGVLGPPAEFTSSHLMPISHLATLIIPDFFGHVASNTYYGTSEFKEGIIAIGSIPFLLSLLGLVSSPLARKTKFFIALFVTTLLLGLKTPIAESFIALNIPVLSTFLPNRIFFIASFSLAALSAIGFQRILQGNRRLLKRLLLAFAGSFALFYASVATLYAYEKGLAQKFGVSFFEQGIERYIRVSVRESLIPAAFVIALLIFIMRFKKNTKYLLVTMIFLLTLSGQLIAGSRYLYFSEPNNEFPDNPIFSFLVENTRQDASRFISLSYSEIPSNVASQYKLYSPEGVDAMYPIWYGEFSQYFLKGKPEIGSLSRIEVAFSEELEKPGKDIGNRWFDLGTISLLSHLGVRYVVVPEDYHYIPPQVAFQKVFSHRWHTIYEYKYAFPKAYFVPTVMISNEKKLTLERIFHPEYFPNLETVIASDSKQQFAQLSIKGMALETNEDLDIQLEKRREKNEASPFSAVKEALEKLSANPVELTHYSPNQIILNADVDTDGFIVINDSFFPGWTAEVDGKSIPIFRANHAFRSVPVEVGLHTITLSYRPSIFDTGVRVSAAAAAVVILVLGISVFRKKRGILNR